MSGESQHAVPASRGPGGRTHDEISTELSSRRTGMSFQRTRMSADRTLMSVIRTSLSLIGFGFTIYQFFQKLHASDVVKSSTAPRHFGQVLVWLGITTLILGIAYHISFMRGLREERQQMTAEGLVHSQSRFPISMILIIALLLLAVGLVAIVSMTLELELFG